MAIRTNTLVEEYEAISMYDEAVDRDAEDFDQKWKVYRDGMGEPPLKPGEKPTTFKMRHLSTTERMYLFELQQSDELGFMVAAAAIALVGIRGANGPDGKPLEVRHEVTQVGPLRIRSATKATLDALPFDVLLELGALVLNRTAARPS